MAARLETGQITREELPELFGAEEILEEWTHRKSVADLASSMALGVDKVWMLADGQEILMPTDRNTTYTGLQTFIS